jgi:hypothetical protein
MVDGVTEHLMRLALCPWGVTVFTCRGFILGCYWAAGRL